MFTSRYSASFAARKGYNSLCPVDSGTVSKSCPTMGTTLPSPMSWINWSQNLDGLAMEVAPEELKALFEELEGIYRTMVFVGGVVGLRVSQVIDRPALV